MCFAFNEHRLNHGPVNTGYVNKIKKTGKCNYTFWRVIRITKVACKLY